MPFDWDAAWDNKEVIHESFNEDMVTVYLKLRADICGCRAILRLYLDEELLNDRPDMAKELAKLTLDRRGIFVDDVPCPCGHKILLRNTTIMPRVSLNILSIAKGGA